MFSIRPAELSDLAALSTLYNHYILTTPITFDIEPYTLEQRQARWFNHYARQGRYRLFVAEQADTVLGYASSSPFASRAAYGTSIEVSIYLNPNAHRQGIGSRLYETLFAALEGEDIHRAYAGITVPNAASVALHRKFGFRSVGIYREVGRKFDRYWDVEWFERTIPHAKPQVKSESVTN
jgi:phosphinothricin acetyltransferase